MKKKIAAVLLPVILFCIPIQVVEGAPPAGARVALQQITTSTEPQTIVMQTPQGPVTCEFKQVNLSVLERALTFEIDPRIRVKKDSDITILRLEITNHHEEPITISKVTFSDRGTKRKFHSQYPRETLQQIINFFKHSEKPAALMFIIFLISGIFLLVSLIGGYPPQQCSCFTDCCTDRLSDFSECVNGCQYDDLTTQVIAAINDCCSARQRTRCLTETSELAEQPCAEYAEYYEQRDIATYRTIGSLVGLVVALICLLFGICHTDPNESYPNRLEIYQNFRRELKQKLGESITIQPETTSEECFFVIKTSAFPGLLEEGRLVIDLT
jgi:hypothetical protein